MADEQRKRRAAEFIEPFRVKPSSKITLGTDFDPEWAPWYVIPADRKWFGRNGHEAETRVAATGGP